jgi:hypothetical protein
LKDELIINAKLIESTYMVQILHCFSLRIGQHLSCQLSDGADGSQRPKKVVNDGIWILGHSVIRWLSVLGRFEVVTRGEK